MSSKQKIIVGGVQIGGGAGLVIQSMCNTKTQDVQATVNQIHALEQAGCQVVRLAVPDMDAAQAIPAIKCQVHIPLVADIHFDHRLALEALKGGIDKIRINPGNIGDKAKVKAVADACKAVGVPIRVGVNSGSVDADLREKYGVRLIPCVRPRCAIWSSWKTAIFMISVCLLRCPMYLAPSRPIV